MSISTLHKGDYDDDDDNNNNNNNNSIGVYWYAGLTAQMPITKPAQRHKWNRNSIIHKNGTLNKQNKNTTARKAL